MFTCRPSEALQEDPRLVFGIMEARSAERILAKFDADAPRQLSSAETRFWARLNRFYEGDEDAFERPDVDAEDEAYERIAAQIAAANQRHADDTATEAVTT